MSARTAWLLATSFALLVLASGFAQARPRPDEMSGPPPSAILTGAALVVVSFDADGDYATSRAEFDAGLVRETDRAFGPATSISPIGFEAWSGRALGGPAMGPFRMTFDRNVDGQITKTEFADAFV